MFHILVNLSLVQTNIYYLILLSVPIFIDIRNITYIYTIDPMPTMDTPFNRRINAGSTEDFEAREESINGTSFAAGKSFDHRRNRSLGSLKKDAHGIAVLDIAFFKKSLNTTVIILVE